MNKLIINGQQEFMGVEIPVIEGGFGEGQKVVLAKTVAEIHKVEIKYINKLINNNITRFNENDLMDIKGSLEEPLNLEFTAREKANYKNIFILSQRGYTKLVAMMDNSNDKKWEVMNNLIDEYFTLKAKEKSRQANLEGLSPQLQALINLELNQKKLAEKIETVREENKEEIQAMRDIITLDSNGWRKETNSIINKIALKLSGFGEINILKKEIYKLLNERLGVDVNRRLLEKQKRMAVEGVCKSKINKINILDVIEEDKKLIDGYVNIVRQYAIKYGVA